MMDVLKSYLVQHKSINIPGLGTIYLERIPARTDIVNKQLLPPQYIYRFDKYFDAPDADFFNYLATHQKMEDYEAIKWYNEFAYNLRTQIRTDEKAAWEGIGVFKKDSSGEIIFEDNNQQPAGLLPVAANRIVRSDASHHILVGDRETTTVQMSELLNDHTHVEKESWWLYALILAAIGLCIAFFHFYRYGWSTGSLF
jgi:nucleoid DNA-binding protein